MKKILCLLVASAVSTIAQADYWAPLSGLYVSGGLGLLNADFNQNASQTINLTSPSAFTFSSQENMTQYSNRFVGGLGLGYSHNFCCRYSLGIEGFANWDRADTTTSVAPAISSPASTLNTSIETKLNWDAGFVFKPGIFIDSDTLVYVLVGPRWGNFQTIYNATFTNSGNTFNANLTRKSTQIGITAGIGAQRDLNGQVSIAAEYAYTSYGSIGTPPSTTIPIVVSSTQIGTASNQNSAKGVTNTFMLKLIYRL